MKETVNENEIDDSWVIKPAQSKIVLTKMTSMFDYYLMPVNEA